mgnify:FL=1
MEKYIRLIAAILLLVAIADFDYGFYMLLRFIICAISVYLAYNAAKGGAEHWVWIFGIIAALFNPFLPVHLNKGLWKIIDSAAAFIFLFSFIKYKTTK